MRIQTQVLYPDYRKLVWYLTFRKPRTTYLLLMGSAMLVLGFLHFSKLFPETVTLNNFPIIEFMLGSMILIIIPVNINQAAKKTYTLTNSRLQEPIEYDIDMKRMKLSGAGFGMEMNWEKIYKLEELDNWFLIYHNKKTSNLIPKRDMTAEEITELRNILKNIDCVNLKKLK